MSKKKAQTTSDLDEERTNQLVSDLLRNIKEKTKELESLNQNLKSNGMYSESKRKSTKIKISSLDGFEPSTFRLTAELANQLRHRDSYETVQQTLILNPQHIILLHCFTEIMCQPQNIYMYPLH